MVIYGVPHKLNFWGLHFDIGPKFVCRKRHVRDLICITNCGLFFHSAWTFRSLILESTCPDC